VPRGDDRDAGIHAPVKSWQTLIATCRHRRAAPSPSMRAVRGHAAHHWGRRQGKRVPWEGFQFPYCAAVSYQCRVHHIPVNIV